MPLPTRDEPREKLAAVVESLGVATARRIATARRAIEGRPSLVRGVGIGAAAVMFVGVVVAIVVGQNSGEPPGGAGQLVVPVITSMPRTSEWSTAPAGRAPLDAGAPPQSATESRRANVVGDSAGPHAQRPAPSAPRAPSAPGSPSGQRALPTEHRVLRGETLAQIALRYDVPVEQIAADSGITDPRRIRPGRRLVIDPKPAHVVVIQPGRTLSDYARTSGRRMADLMRLNPRLTNPNWILAGGRLHV